ncbi:hypothetical protein BDC45DRAFT_78514 [Circinella umbellata]|nr:hypothetical protein BDC45DRAFT_78514 [Circinella umbellata]
MDIKQGPITRQRLRASKNTPPLPSQPIESQSPRQPSSTSITPTPTKRIASIDDSIWDIGKAYAQKDRIVLTYSKKTKQQEQQKQQDVSSILPKHLTEPTSTASPSTSSSATSSSQKENNNHQETLLTKSQPKRAPKRKLNNDIKGKGKAISHQQTKKTSMTPSIPTTTSSSTTTTMRTTFTSPIKEQQQTSSSTEPLSTAHLNDGTQQPQSSPIITSPNIQNTPLYDEIFNTEENDDLELLAFSPIRPINSFRHPTILQQHQGIMQSTPNTQLSRIKKSGFITTSDDDDDQMKGKKVLEEEEDPRKRLKPFSPPSSPSRRLNNNNNNNRNYSLSPMTSPIYQMTSPNNQSYYSQSLWIPEEEEEEEEEEEDTMIMTMENQNVKEDELMEQVNELSEEELNMTVEEYIISLMNKEIENVETKSNEYIQQIQSTVDRIRQQIMNK